MKIRIPRVLWVAGILAILLCQGEAVAATAAVMTATEMVRSMLEAVVSVQTNPTLQGPQSRATRSADIRKIIESSFDFDDMAKEALGPQWEKLNDKQRVDFKSVFQSLFLDSYTRLVLDFLSREKIEYKGEEDKQGKEAIVKTVIQRTDEQIPVDYSLLQKTGKWQVRDVAVDDVSIVGNYRKSFARVMKQESYEGLMKKMRTQQKASEKR